MVANIKAIKKEDFSALTQKEREDQYKEINDYIEQVKAERRDLKILLGKLYEVRELTENNSTVDLVKNLRVSDHAIVRYLERMADVDIDAIRKHIKKEATYLNEIIVKRHGNWYVSLDGTAYVIKNGTVVTVMDRESRF